MGRVPHLEPPYLLQQQHRARLQLTLTGLEQQPVQRALHLSCKYRVAHQAGSGTAQSPDWALVGKWAARCLNFPICTWREDDSSSSPELNEGHSSDSPRA